MAEVGRNSRIAPAYPGLERDRPRIDANDLGSDSRPFAVKIRSRFGSFLLRSCVFYAGGPGLCQAFFCRLFAIREARGRAYGL